MWTSTGLLVTKVCFLLNKRSFLGEKIAGGRRAQKHRTFVVRFLVNWRSFLENKKRRRPPRTEAQGFLSQKCVFCSKTLFWGEKKRRRPPRTEVQLFLSHKCVFCSKGALFWGGKHARGRHAQKYSFLFVTKLCVLLNNTFCCF